MANTFTVTKTDRGNKQFQGAFKEMFFVSGTIPDQDSIGHGTDAIIDITIPGIQLGDIVMASSVDINPEDADSSLCWTLWVTAANTLAWKYWVLDTGSNPVAADTLNGATFKIIIGRPNW